MSDETSPIHSPLRGLSTVVFPVDDFEAAKAWYTKVFGVPPYMDTPAYAEFRVGDYQHEFGLLNVPMSGGFAEAPKSPGGAIVYWYVEAAEGEIARLVELGATIKDPPRDFGQGFIGASVLDPFGHILAVMNNPHYRKVLDARAVK